MATAKFNAGVDPAMDEYSIPGGEEILLVATKARISSGCKLDHLAQHRPFFYSALKHALYSA